MKRLTALVIFTILVLLSGPPIAALLISSLQLGALTPNVRWSLDNYREVFVQLSSTGPVLNSLIFASASAALALALGALLAFIVERTNTPLRRFGYVVAIIVVAIPASVYAIAWMLMFSRTGLVNVSLGWIAAQLGLDFTPLRISNLWGMIFVEGFNYAPLAFLLLVGPMRSMDRALEEAALTSGASSRQVLRYITAPLLLPAGIAILLLTFVRAIEAFSIPAIIGLPGRVRVVTTEIYFATMQQLPPNYGVAGAYGMLLIVLVAVFLYIYTSVTARASRFATVTGKGFRARTIELGRSKYLFTAVIILYFLILAVLPMIALVTASMQNYYAGLRFTNLTFDQYRDLFSYPQIAASFINSVIVGMAAALVIMSVTTVSAWISVRSSGPMQRAVEFAVSLPLVLPGIVLGLALLQIYARIPLPIYGTLVILVIASVTRFIPFGYRYAHAGLLQLHPELEEAGLMSGATRFQVARAIVMPLIALPLLAGFIYIFLISVRELEASVLLVTSNTPMVAPLLLNLFENGFIPQVAAFSVTIVAIFGTLAFVFYLVARRYGLSVQ